MGHPMQRALLILALLLLRSHVVAASGEGVPTFTRDVAPILYASCVVCHRPGQIAPMSLMRYEDARPWSRAIKNKVVARKMPPWGAPDIVVPMPFTFEIPAEGQVPIQDFYVTDPFQEDFWAEAVEIRPGNHRVVHHSGAYAVELQPRSRIKAGRLVRPPKEAGRR